MQWLDVIKDVFIECMKVETRTPYGKMNLGFGVLLTVLSGVVMIPSMAINIIQCVFPSVDLLIPWYGLILILIGLGIFFIVCIKYVGAIEKSHSASIPDDK